MLSVPPLDASISASDEEEEDMGSSSSLSLMTSNMSVTARSRGLRTSVAILMNFLMPSEGVAASNSSTFF